MSIYPPVIVQPGRVTHVPEDSDQCQNDIAGSKFIEGLVCVLLYTDQHCRGHPVMWTLSLILGALGTCTGPLGIGRELRAQPGNRLLTAPWTALPLQS